MRFVVIFHAFVGRAPLALRYAFVQFTIIVSLGEN